MTVLVVNSLELAAATIRVPEDHKTIQAGIDAANAGDVVLVAAGPYSERILLRPRITVKSAGDVSKGELGLKRAEATIIDGNVKRTRSLGLMHSHPDSIDSPSLGAHQPSPCRVNSRWR